MRTTIALALLATLSGPAPVAAAQEVLTSGRPVPPEQACYDVLSYRLELRVDPETRSISGTGEMRGRLLEDAEVVSLDLSDAFEVTGLHLVDGAGRHEVSGVHEDGEVRLRVGDAFRARGVAAGEEFTVAVQYHGQPRVAPNPPWDGGFQWSKTASGAPWIATSNQMQGADLWWPCKDQPDDEPDAMDIVVSVPEGVMCVSNGQLVEGGEVADGWSRWHWRVTTPINAYGVALNIAPYETITREYESVAGDTFPITYWVLPENLEKGKVLFEDILRQTRWFEETFGPYPFRGDKYGVAETPHLGMEHQTIIAYGNEYRGNPWGDDQGFDFLHHHEMAHEWWANLVTCRNWKDFWIHESFATYAQALYTEHLNGPAAYRHRMEETRGLLANVAPIAPREDMDAASIYQGGAGGDIYYKGAWALHTLRFLVGDETFFRALRRMAYPEPELEAKRDGSACRFADTEEIVRIAEEVTGHELDWFFELYLRQPRLPELLVAREGSTLVLRWKTPKDLPFPMPVEIEVGAERRRIELQGGEARVEVGKAKVTIDPDRWLLKKDTDE